MTLLDLLHLYGFNVKLADGTDHPALAGCLERLKNWGTQLDKLSRADCDAAWRSAACTLPIADQPTLYSELKSIGIKMDNHESDLYVPYLPQVMQVLQKYPQDLKNSRLFISNIEKTTWIDISFVYKPYWDACDAKMDANRGAKREATNVTSQEA